MLRVIVCTAAFLLAADALCAQADPDSVQLRNGCRLARQVIETGNPSPHTEWALRQIGGCGPEAYGASLAVAVRRLRTETDTVVLREFWRPSRFLRDGELFRASRDIAADQGASTQARVFALLSLLHTVRFGRTADYRNMIGGFETEEGLQWVRGGCAQTIVNDDIRLDGAPLPADFHAQIRSLASRLRADGAEPLDVRTAAFCLAT